MSYPYTPLQEIGQQQQPAVATEQATQTPVNEPSATDLCSMKRSTRWVVVNAIFQLGLGIFSLFAGGFLWFVVSTLFACFGIVGAIKKRVRLLKAHFVYSVVLYILSLIGVVLMIIYCNGCSIWAYVAVFFGLLIQATGMRHSRLLLNFLNTYPQYATVGCRSWRCKSETACNTTANNNNNQVAIPMETAQPVENKAPVQQTLLPAPVPVQQLPVYMPQQQMYAVPQYYPMQTAQYKYPVMMPMPMQQYPYPVPVPPQEPAPSTLYPTVPGVYRTN